MGRGLLWNHWQVALCGILATRWCCPPCLCQEPSAKAPPANTVVPLQSSAWGRLAWGWKKVPRNPRGLSFPGRGTPSPTLPKLLTQLGLCNRIPEMGSQKWDPALLAACGGLPSLSMGRGCPQPLIHLVGVCDCTGNT